MKEPHERKKFMLWWGRLFKHTLAGSRKQLLAYNKNYCLIRIKHPEWTEHVVVKLFQDETLWTLKRILYHKSSKFGPINKEDKRILYSDYNLLYPSPPTPITVDWLVDL